MYSEWNSLFSTVSENSSGSQSHSVLRKFDREIGKSVTQSVVKELAVSLGITQAAVPSALTQVNEIQWCMDVICFGLSLPFSEHETIKDCVNIYCDWLTALCPSPKISVPKPIKENPNMYARIMINHMHNLFIPRREDGSEGINRQAVLCHRVLRIFQEIAQTSKSLDQESWNAILLFLLAINDILLGSPAVPEDAGDQLCERVLSVLFEIWLIACVKQFPPPSLWKTLQECCKQWRHRMALIDQWNRVNIALTVRLLQFMYGSTEAEYELIKHYYDVQLIPQGMTNDCIAQSWYRFLHTLGSPVALCLPSEISRTPKFMQWSLKNEKSLEPHQHPCLKTLPDIFLKAIRGIGCQVDAFLGLHSAKNHKPAAQAACNSILHLFGDWLFEAAQISNENWVQSSKSHVSDSSLRPIRKSSLSQPSSLDSVVIAEDIHTDKYEAGQAEAIGILCRIFSAKKTGEEILPVYLARFYSALQLSLQSSDSRECSMILANMLCNSDNLLRSDLDGIELFLPLFIKAIELVLPERELRLRPQAQRINRTELRKSTINILLSIISLPLHFQAMSIRDITTKSTEKTINLMQFKPRIINAFIKGLLNETDPVNTHMLLGGLSLCIQEFTWPEQMPDSVSLMRHASPISHDLSNPGYDHFESTGSFSEGSSIGGQSTATISNYEFPSLTMSTDITTDLHILDLDGSIPTQNLFVKVTYIVCHRLVSSWKSDLNVSLAALEFLSVLARIHPFDLDVQEYRRVLKWICEYIVYQCSRPPPAHSKDLHSAIVAAFQCISIWLTEHGDLLLDRECLISILEVIELGISGSKSVNVSTETVKYKDGKELKPVSMRVRDAAESILTIIMEQIDPLNVDAMTQGMSSQLNEVMLMKCCNVNSKNLDQQGALNNFKYYVTENSTMLALLDEPLGNSENLQPTVTVLIRNPFGRHVWTMQHRFLPRSKSKNNFYSMNPGRPIPMNDMPIKVENDTKWFPESIDRISGCAADYSIPTIEQISNKTNNMFKKKLSSLLENQTVSEKLLWAEADNSVDVLSHKQESVPPAICQDYQTSRLFLSHFGMLPLVDEDEITMDGSMTEKPQLIALDTTSAEFASDLNLLDKISPRSYDTVHIFYVKSNQTSASDIVSNTKEDSISSLDPLFRQVLLSLGDPVEVSKHSGWTGFVNTSWKSHLESESENNDTVINKDSLQFNGEKMVLYWSDVNMELAFVMPSNSNYTESKSSERIRTDESSEVFESGAAVKQPIGTKTRTMSLELEKSKGSTEPIPPNRRRTAGSKPLVLLSSVSKIFFVWLESFEDHLSFPTEALCYYTHTGEDTYGNVGLSKATDCHIIFIHPLNSGLLRIKLKETNGRLNFATPLVDGMVVSRKLIGHLVRQTIFNISKRKRLDNEGYQPPHVRRRHKIQEIIQRYKKNNSDAGLLANLLIK